MGDGRRRDEGGEADEGLPRVELPEVKPLPVPPPLPGVPEVLTRESAAEARLKRISREEVHGLARQTEQRAEALRKLGALTGMGIELVASIIVGGAVGWGLDALTGSTPGGVIAGAVLGIGVGLVRLFRRARDEQRGGRSAGPRGAGRA